MANILLVYGTKEGHTGKIAQVVMDELSRLGHAVEIYRPAKDLDLTFDESFDAVVVGAPVHYSKFPDNICRWVSLNAPLLSKKTGAFFSVCLGILEKGNDQTQRAERKIVEDFFRQSNWHPESWAIFPGALAWTQYGWLKKWMMKRIVKKAGGAVDTSRDYEYTDWDEVRRFARDFAKRLESEPTAGVL